MRWLREWRTYYRLGFGNLFRVFRYRMGLKTGLHKAVRLRANVITGPYFDPVSIEAPANLKARDASENALVYFGCHSFAIDRFPDWHLNPFNGQRADATSHWSAIADFNPALGDIKTVWEPSRLDWAVPMAQQAALGDDAMRLHLNAWLTDWSTQNPPYYGSNWKCGQEASIRVMHLLLCALILGQHDNPTASLVALVKLHLERIAPTLSYAIAQQNNHGTSEAAALFMGGDFLARCGIRGGIRWHRKGRHWLENRARVLIENDGSFSQYSVVYHRLMLDTFTLAETWRRATAQPGFSEELRQKLGAATHWLHNMTDAQTGDAPNIGANDGAHIARLAQSDYRDFRPSIQWAAALFLQARAYAPPGEYDQSLVWLGLPLDLPAIAPRTSASYDDGGWHVLRQGNAKAVMRYPRFRFRPSQADALHVDLWVNSHNLLPDSGTYSYNPPPENAPDLGATAAHNTVTFGNRDQMPRLGKFLFGSWLKARNVEPCHGTGDAVTAAAGYVDHMGSTHDRSVILTSRSLTCTDILGGPVGQATLRWHLAGSGWRLDSNKAVQAETGYAVEVDAPGAMRLTTGIVSRYYLEKTETTVLEVKIPVPSRITTVISFPEMMTD